MQENKTNDHVNASLNKRPYKDVSLIGIMPADHEYCIKMSFKTENNEIIRLRVDAKSIKHIEKQIKSSFS
jgi:hypothetical protein